MRKITPIDGYTLIEVLLTLSIVTIFLSMAVPNFTSSYSHLKTLVVSHQIINEISLARGEAIKKQQQVSYCADINGIWNKRYIRDARGLVLHSFSPLPSPYRLLLKSSLGKNQKITFTHLGFTIAERGSFYLFAPDKTVRIVITVSGRTRIEELFSR